MKTKVASFLDHPRWVMAIAIALAVVAWAYYLYNLVGQVGHLSPGFIFDGTGQVNALTPPYWPGPKSGLRAGDIVLALNGQPVAQWRDVLRQAAPGEPVVYTVLRGAETLEIAVPPMQFKWGTLLWESGSVFVFCLVCMAVGLFVYARNPASNLSRLVLLYNLAWAVSQPVCWDQFLGRRSGNALSAYFVVPLIITTCAIGWIFFWSFPADEGRKRFLARSRLREIYAIMAGLSWVYFPLLFSLAVRLSRPGLWSLYGQSVTWLNLVAWGGSLLNKPLPAVAMALNTRAPRLLRQQAQVLALGIGLGFFGYVAFAWGPLGGFWPPPGDFNWGYVLIILYPLAIGYAVLRYQAFDVRVVIRRGLVYSILTAGLTAIFLVLSMAIGNAFQSWTGQETFLAAVLPALVVAVMFRPAQTRVQNWVDRTFFRHEYEVRQTLTGFSRGLSTLREQDEVTRLVLDTVTQTLGAEQATFWLLDPEHKAYRTAAQTAGTSDVVPELPAESDLPFTLFSEHRALMLPPSDTSPQAVELHNLGAVLAVPLIAEQRLLGFLTLGTKRSGLLYTDDDLDLLATLAQSATLALENARLHEERLAILRQQLAQVTAAQEEERQRIARELHDGVGPALASLNLRLRTAAKSVQPNPAAAQELKELADLTQANIQDIRRLIYDLRPAVLDELGLVAALREYVDRYQQEQGLSVMLSLPEGRRRLPAPLETTVFRVIQEALTNAARHAKARHVDVALDWDAAQVTLRIADDGQGFDLHEAAARAKGGQHLGLWSMRERIEQLGGQLDMQSAPGSGTTIQATVPLTEA
jgi:signal transduction histidine kinase